MHHNHLDQTDLPPELCVKPQCLIGISGLDTLNNAVHKTIWDAFNSNRRVERAPVTFKLLSNAYEFPVIKPKRNSYEWYIPKGILKRNWMVKHLNEIPAVAVIFYDVDWNDGLWNEKMIECSSRVQSIRAALEGRNTRITVVLIQQMLPMPVGEDVLAAERAAALCASCELNSKSLFVLPLGDHLQGYTVRLENAFYDLAQNYYHHEARNIKSHRDHLNKTTHQYLFVRHQFKMGFLNEMKQDKNTAHKHYTYAYNNLLELRIVDTNALEIKTVAGFINYKVCRLMFALNQPRDAISQFRAHIDRFKTRLGFRELKFEHHAWLANQYNIFGDVFDEAVKLGLPAVQTQHPGFYYQQAAQHAILRKHSCQELCQYIIEYPNPDPLEGIGHMEFYGQRPWRPGKLSAEPPDPHREQNGIQALQYLEKQINHSNLIISYYGQAISQFKTYRCPRMRRHLVVQMADEYYNSYDYGKALTLLTHMLWDYRTEGWWNLISDILQKALNCAYLSANIQDYVTLSLEMLGSLITISKDNKIRLFHNLMCLLKKNIPEPEQNLSETQILKAKELWKFAILAEPTCISIDMSNITSCVDSKARFTWDKFEADQNVTIEIFIRSTCLSALHFTHLCVTVNTPNYSSEFAIESTNPSLLFESNMVKKFIVEFTPDVQDVGQEIQIGSILLHLGNNNERCAILRFSGTGNNFGIHPELQHFRLETKDKLNFDNIKPLGTAMIVPRLSKVKLDVIHNQPALVGEWYKVTITVTNAELFPIKNVEITISMDIDEVETELATEFSPTPTSEFSQKPLMLKIPNLLVGRNSSTMYYMRSHRTGDRNVTVRLAYLLEMEKYLDSVKEIVVNVPVCKAFDVTTKYFSHLFEPVQTLYMREPFIVMPQVRCCSQWPIVIEKTAIEFSSIVRSLDKEVETQLLNIQLKNEEMAAEVYMLEACKPSDISISIGMYTLNWKREESEMFNITQVPLKGLLVDEVPLFVEVVLPAHGYVRTPMPVAFKLHNQTSELLQIEFNMDISEAFMIAGYKQIQISILPKGTRTVNYNLYPLIPGNVMLPKLRLNVNESDLPINIKQSQITALLERCIPTHIYIMPQVKGNPRSPPTVDNTVMLVGFDTCDDSEELDNEES